MELLELIRLLSSREVSEKNSLVWIEPYYGSTMMCTVKLINMDHVSCQLILHGNSWDMSVPCKLCLIYDWSPFLVVLWAIDWMVGITRLILARFTGYSSYSTANYYTCVVDCTSNYAIELPGITSLWTFCQTLNMIETKTLHMEIVSHSIMTKTHC